MFSSSLLLEGRPKRCWSSMLKSPFFKARKQFKNPRTTQSLFLESPEAFLMISWVFSQGGSKISNKFFVPLNHTSWFREGHKNYLHENWPCGRYSCYRKTSISLLTVEGLGKKHWCCPSPTPPRSAALRLVSFFLGPPTYTTLCTNKNLNMYKRFVMYSCKNIFTFWTATRVRDCKYKWKEIIKFNWFSPFHTMNTQLCYSERLNE